MKVQQMVSGLSGVAIAAACGSGGTGQANAGTTGTLRFGLSTDATHDVASVHYSIVPSTEDCSGAPVAERDVPLEEEALPLGLRAPGVGSGHRFADAFVTLEPGAYLICATPLSESGNPSAECAPAEALASVLSGATTETTLVSVCVGAESGGLDAVTVLDTPPHIDDLQIEPSKFVTSCETATFEVEATDPDGDELSYEWQVVTGHAPLSSEDSEARFGPAAAGDYEVEITVRDAYGQGSSLTFPVHVSASDECPACDASTWQPTQKLIPSDGGPADTFQVSVSVSGERALLGTFSDEDDEAEPGVAYAFERSETDWVETQSFTAPDGVPRDRFGNDVAIDGDTALVGAFNAEPDGRPHRGAAYIFSRDDSGWSFAQKLVGPDTVAGSAFGSAVALSGDTAAVASTAGVHIYRRTGGSWSIEQVLFPDVPSSAHLALEGDRLLAGYSCDPTAPITIFCAGAALVFQRSGTTWIQEQKLLASDGARLTNFGTSVALAGEWAFVGAPLHTDGGAVYAYQHVGTSWIERQILEGSDVSASAQFAWQLAATTEDLLVDAAFDNATYAFKLDGDAWTETQKLTPLVESEFSWGSDVALSGHTAFMGVMEGPPSAVRSSATVFETCGG